MSVCWGTSHKGRSINLKASFVFGLLLFALLPVIEGVTDSSSVSSNESYGTSTGSSSNNVNSAYAVPSVSDDVFSMLAKEEVHKALAKLSAQTDDSMESLLEMSSTATSSLSSTTHTYRGVPVTSATADDIGMKFIHDIVEKTRKSDIIASYKDVSIDEFLHKDFKPKHNSQQDEVSFLEMNTSLDNTDYHPTGSNDPDGRADARPSRTQSTRRRTPTPSASLLQQQSTTDSSETMNEEPQPAGAEETASRQDQAYEAPKAPPSFTQWLSGSAAGAGETAENLGVEYKPDPRRHPPPPPVPSPPPPPPPPSFSSESPMAAYSFIERGASEQTVRQTQTPKQQPNMNANTQAQASQARQGAGKIDIQSVADRLRQVRALQDNKRKGSKW